MRILVLLFGIFLVTSISGRSLHYESFIRGNAISGSGFFVVEDYTYMDMLQSGVGNYGFENDNLENLIFLKREGLTGDASYFDSPWSLSVDVEVTGYDLTGSIASVTTQTMSLSYDPESSNYSKDVAILDLSSIGVSSWQLAHKFGVRVVGYSYVLDGVSQTTVPDDILLQGVVKLDRYYDFDGLGVVDVVIDELPLRSRANPFAWNHDLSRKYN